MKAFTYIIGEPGVGKSTLMAHLTRGLWKRVEAHPFAHTVYACGVTELGSRQHGAFPGTDALSMAVQPQVVDWLIREQPELVIAEGARLGNGKFFTEVERLGYRLRVYALVGPELAELRRRLRGTGPDDRFVRSQRSKVATILASREVFQLAASEPLAAVEMKMINLGDSVVSALRTSVHQGQALEAQA